MRIAWFRPDVPDTTTPDTTVPAPTGGSQTTDDGQLPHTGTSSTTLVAGGLLLLGLGLGALRQEPSHLHRDLHR